MGNQDRSNIVGKEDIILETSTGCNLVLKDVRHVPAMRLNLISAGKLDDVGLVNYFGEGKWKLTKGSLTMAREKKEGSLYVMQAKLCKGEINITYDDMEVWHKRLGHISEKGLHMLTRKDLLPDVKGNNFVIASVQTARESELWSSCYDHLISRRSSLPSDLRPLAAPTNCGLTVAGSPSPTARVSAAADGLQSPLFRLRRKSTAHHRRAPPSPLAQVSLFFIFLAISSAIGPLEQRHAGSPPSPAVAATHRTDSPLVHRCCS
ncbi:unnamed protein product [Cuscuta campestris]|uniref:Uncharacterized protein n=1 Tax=Cuscuta campestris TaxID=132261 RepID=A0A484LWV5_9ASTE|nr:unnamed protein product [Cuscuta campestris]